MNADHIPKIFRPFSDVLPDQFRDIQTSGAEQSNNISRSVVPRMMDLPIPIRFCCQTVMVADGMVAEGLQFFARGFSREFDELLKYLH